MKRNFQPLDRATIRRARITRIPAALTSSTVESFHRSCGSFSERKRLSSTFEGNLWRRTRTRNRTARSGWSRLSVSSILPATPPKKSNFRSEEKLRPERREAAGCGMRIIESGRINVRRIVNEQRSIVNRNDINSHGCGVAWLAMERASERASARLTPALVREIADKLR